MTDVIQAAPTAPEPPTWRAHLRDPKRWKKSLADVALWFLFGLLLTGMLREFAPGRPIIVGSNSIPTGLYWLDTRVTTFKVGDYVSFPFQPKAAWLRERYGEYASHTKLVWGVGGDTVYADQAGALTVCRAPRGAARGNCESAGVPQGHDSKGRPMTPWASPGHHYTLADNELWIYAPNPKSLDSRYAGPVARQIIRGVATPLLLWGEHPR